MKKFFTCLAALALVGAAHSASLNWSINQIKVDGTLLTGGSAYLFIVEQSSDFGKPTTTVAEITSLIENDKDFTTYAAGNKGTVNNGMVSGATGYYEAFQAGDSLTAFAVIFDAAKENYIVTATRDASWTSATGSKTLNFGSQANAKWNPVSPSSSVPEPGTAALALLGVGLLFKRRRA